MPCWCPRPTPLRSHLSIHTSPFTPLHSQDATLTREGESVTDGHGAPAAEQGGRPFLSARLSLPASLSYDEMPLSALLAVSAPSLFINAGARDNRGPQSGVAAARDGQPFSG